MQIIIRPATKEDANGILEAHQDSIRKVASKDYNQVQISGWSDHLKPEGYVRAMDAGESVFVAVIDNKIVGFSALRESEVMAVYVASNAVGFGVARLLYLAIENLALENQATKLSLSASLTAEGFYQHLGFSKLYSSSHKLNSGVEIPCIRMEKNL
jgi:GNAT superfamily N-acetyltransferase